MREAPSPDEVEGQPVHEERLQGGDSHGEVHAQLVLGPPHQHALRSRLRQDLQPQRPDLGGEGRALGQGLVGAALGHWPHGTCCRFFPTQPSEPNVLGTASRLVPRTRARPGMLSSAPASGEEAQGRR